MADTVRYLMEEMVPELEDMQKRRYFSKAEIREIVKRRQEFEYKLKRKAALKEDFLSYAEYEAKLDQLRQARRRGLGLSQAKQTLADYSMVRRVHFIFERATRKFKRDLSIWTRWLEFCRATRSNRRLSRVAARALQLHPNAPGLWTYAAAWEFEDNGNPAAARALMQQGLRMCKDSRQMWISYFDMELAYAQKLRARRAALGLDVPADEAAAEQGRQQQQQQQQQEAAEQGQQQGGEDGEGPMEGDGGEGGGGGSGSILAAVGGEQRGGEADADAAVAAVLTGAIAAVVARSAAAALPRDLALRRGLLEAAAKYGFPGVRALSAGVLAGIEADFPQDPEAVDVLARAAADPSDPAAPEEAVAASGQRFEAAIAACAAEGDEGEGGEKQRRRRAGERRGRLVELWRLYCSYLQQRLAALMAAASGDEARVAAAAGAAQQLLHALQRAHEAGCAGEEVYQLWSDVALQLKQKKMALRAAKLACEAFPRSPGVWRRRVALEARLRGAGAAAAQQLLAVLREALRAVPADAAPQVWLLVLEACAGQPSDLQALAALLVQAQMGCARGPPSGGMGDAAGRVLAAVWDACGAAAGRQLFAQLAALPPAGGDFYRHALQLEGRELEAAEAARDAGAKAARAAALQRVRRVLEAAVDAYGDADAGLWLAYARFEQQHARGGGGGVYWRAVKALADPEPFIQEYRSSVCADAPAERE
ncbi:U3 small nucleolar RNA-associated protein [Raphidocelis subcapitata]|uniref:U3 small nucleolar RNA-associated protein n=1 Tax=Raphidocelis subcapitata TaxID=307507 RepID=A0A2V0NST8_9CHLO|nr:U3 small nucleolar RNA-associated protein [Raphidocelis subcapitata]|eukprot:GBF90696.1 U3 small nucleolar RNA-associated protein [Raphidocelis subcapitata]